MLKPSVLAIPGSVKIEPQRLPPLESLALQWGQRERRYVNILGVVNGSAASVLKQVPSNVWGYFGIKTPAIQLNPTFLSTGVMDLVRRQPLNPGRGGGGGRGAKIVLDGH